MKVSTSPEITYDSVATHLKDSIQGTPANFDDKTISEVSDVTRIKKQYKLGALPSPGPQSNGPQPDAAKDDSIKRQLELSLIGAIALRGS